VSGAVEERTVKALAWVISAVFEQDFVDCSHGFRPARSVGKRVKPNRGFAQPFAGKETQGPEHG
jgi:hypothetical protein